MELKKIKRKFNIFKVNNDHGLDSGAWIKIIKSNLWKKYDYCLFLMEGFVFTDIEVLDSLDIFTKKHRPDFISSAHEKRLFNYNTNKLNKNFKEKKINSLWNFFLKFKKIKKFIYQKNYTIIKNKKFKNITEHHVGKYQLNLLEKSKLFIKSLLFFRDLIGEKNSVLISSNRKYLINEKHIGQKKIKIKKISYHQENNPLFYGCSCQHLFSKKMIADLKKFFKQHEIYNKSKQPYFGEVFEVIWGMLPFLLKKKKWFFSGIHRIRKNFINFKREDDSIGMTNYLNFYYKDKIDFFTRNKKIKFRVIDNRFKYIKNYID